MSHLHLHNLRYIPRLCSLPSFHLHLHLHSQSRTPTTNTDTSIPSSPSNMAPPSPPRPPSIPRPSASLLLIASFPNPSHTSPTHKLLLVQRSPSRSMSFSSAIVFPGGNLDAGQDWFLTSSSGVLLYSEEALASPPTGDLLTALKTCAVRETFEETGVLFATSSQGPQYSPTEAEKEALKRGRQVLLNNPPPETFKTVLEGLKLKIPLEEMSLLTTWVTPKTVKGRRWRTSMFVGFIPEGLEVPETSVPPEGGNVGKGEAGEIAQTGWMTPAEILGMYHHQGKPRNTDNSLSGSGEEGYTSTSPAPDASRRIVLFPPQVYLLTRLQRVFDKGGDVRKAVEELSRGEMGEFIIEPYVKKMDKEKGRTLLGLDRPRGDKERYVGVDFRAGTPSDVEVVERKDVEEGGKTAKL